MTTADPLSAGLITMSVLSRKLFSARRSSIEILSLALQVARASKLCSTVGLTCEMKTSKASFLPFGGIQLLGGLNGRLSSSMASTVAKYSFKRSLLLYLSRSSRISVEFSFGGLGQKESPLDSNCSSPGQSGLPERLTTVDGVGLSTGLFSFSFLFRRLGCLLRPPVSLTNSANFFLRFSISRLASGSADDTVLAMMSFPVVAPCSTWISFSYDFLKVVWRAAPLMTPS